MSELISSWAALPRTARTRLASAAGVAVAVAIVSLLFQLSEPVLIALVVLWLLPAASRYWWLQTGRWQGIWWAFLLDLVAVIVTGSYEVVDHPGTVARGVFVALIGVLFASAMTVIARRDTP